MPARIEGDAPLSPSRIVAKAVCDVAMRRLVQGNRKEHWDDPGRGRIDRRVDGRIIRPPTDSPEGRLAEPIGYSRHVTICHSNFAAPSGRVAKF